MNVEEASKPHLEFIDCARGYAVLMVLTTHLTNHYPNLPYPAHRLAITGWFGVQLFFLASCLTLMMSWNIEKLRNGSVDIPSFFIRRFFRIAPAYYLAGAFYYFVYPPPKGFSAIQALTSMLFVNAWTPDWTPTTQHAWYVVPGGWSIGVEFTFYLLFPLFASLVTSMTRAAVSVVICLAVGVFANDLALRWLSASYQPATVDNFLYFWFPNQLCVFALGGVVYFIIQWSRDELTAWGRFLKKHAERLSFVAILTFCALAYVPLGKYLGRSPALPAFYAASLTLAGFLVSLSTNRGLMINRFAAAIGKVSFSAYLLQFAVLRVFDLFPLLLQTQTSGVRAIAAFTFGWFIAVPLTYAASLLTYHAIEKTSIKAGKAAIRLKRHFFQKKILNQT
jgi:peptidoglycan/LPS O-acetylase OafA/YrhL